MQILKSSAYLVPKYLSLAKIIFNAGKSNGECLMIKY